MTKVAHTRKKRASDVTKVRWDKWLWKDAMQGACSPLNRELYTDHSIGASSKCVYVFMAHVDWYQRKNMGRVDPAPLAVDEIAQGTRLGLAMVHVHLKRLIAAGWVEKVAKGTYRALRVARLEDVA